MRDEQIGIFVNNKSYIPVCLAADLTGYHKDYIGRLCRERKIDGIKIGNNWLVSQKDILNLSSKNGSEKNVVFSTSEIPVIDNISDEWDKALFNDLSAQRPSANKKDEKFNVASPIFLYAFIIISFLTGFLFYRHPESIYANFKDFQKFSNLAAASFQETAVDFKETARQTTLNLQNQVRSLSLSLSLSRQTS